MEQEHHSLSWRWGIVAAVALMLLALYPQLAFRRAQGSAWAGSYFSYHADEAAYLAYVNALIDGRPRRNDPYTDRDDLPSAPQPESILSIHFVPAYLIAVPARLCHISAQTAFIILNVLMAAAATLAVYLLIALVTSHGGLAATGTLIVLCGGSLLRAPVLLRLLAHTDVPPLYFPFLRSYVPAVAVPLFFLLCALVWCALTVQAQRRALLFSLLTGLTFILLIYSYFFLWTAAAAWLGLLAGLWLMGHAGNYKRTLKTVSIISLCALAGLLPYWYMLTQRAATTDVAQALTHTHRPDILRPSELLGLLSLCVVIFCVRRGLFAWREPRVRFIVSLALLPCVVFNQQIVSGLSLQPIHYEQFIVNYVVLVAIVLTAALVLQSRVTIARKATQRVLAGLALLALGWGLLEMRSAVNAHLEVNRLRDEIRPAALRLAQLGALAPATKPVHDEVVLVTNVVQADNLPVDAPQPVLWAPHMRSFAGVTLTEDKERYYQQLYYTGTDAARFDYLLRHTLIAPSSIFGWERVNQRLTANEKPITEAEINVEVSRYGEYVASFDHEHAARLPLAYVVAPVDGADFTNLDRWYKRNEGERVGKLILYRLTMYTAVALQGRNLTR
ncbi:MAG: hypothetical protein ACJ74W_09460 [Pyrinomonadaceae bacterium]